MLLLLVLGGGGGGQYNRKTTTQTNNREESQHNTRGKRYCHKCTSQLPVASKGAVGWKAAKHPDAVATQVADVLSDDSRHNFAVLFPLPVTKMGAVG